MTHPFSPNASTDITKCEICGRDWLSHSSAALCDECGARGKCNIIDEKLLCENKCHPKYEQSLKNDIKSAEDYINPIIEKARSLDAKMKYSGYFFNAETVSHNDIKIAIDSDDSIPSEDKKNRFFMEMVRRFETFQKEIVDIDEQKHKLVEGQLAIAQTLRQYGNEVREEIRNKLKASDTLYAPLNVTKAAAKKSVKSVTESPFERMAQQVAAKRNVSIAEAKRMLIENGMMPS